MRIMHYILLMTLLSVVITNFCYAAPAPPILKPHEEVIATIPAGIVPNLIVGSLGESVLFTTPVDGMVAVRQNQHELGRYPAILPHSLRYSIWGEGTVVVAVIDEKHHIIINGKDWGIYDQILDGTPNYATSDYVTFFSQIEGKWGAITIELSTRQVYKSTKLFDEIRIDDTVRSSDGWYSAYIGRQGTQWRVVHNGEPGRLFDDISRVILSPDGKSAVYAARTGAQWYALSAGRGSSLPFEAIGTMAVGNGGPIAFAARTGATWSLQYVGPERPVAGPDGAPGKLDPNARFIRKTLGGDWDAIGAPVFSADNALIAYPVQQNGKWCVVVNDRQEPWYDQVDTPIFAGETLIYATRTGTSWTLIVDGKPEPVCAAIEAITVSPDGKHIAYAAQQADHWVIIRDGVAGMPFRQVGAPVFSADSASLMYAAQYERKSWTIMMNEHPGAEYPGLVRPTVYRYNDKQYPYPIHYLALRPAAQPSSPTAKDLDVVLVTEDTRAREPARDGDKL